MPEKFDYDKLVGPEVKLRDDEKEVIQGMIRFLQMGQGMDGRDVVMIFPSHIAEPLLLVLLCGVAAIESNRAEYRPV